MCPKLDEQLTASPASPYHPKATQLEAARSSSPSGFVRLSQADQFFGEGPRLVGCERARRTIGTAFARACYNAAANTEHASRFADDGNMIPGGLAGSRRIAAHDRGNDHIMRMMSGCATSFELTRPGRKLVPFLIFSSHTREYEGNGLVNQTASVLISCRD